MKSVMSERSRVLMVILFALAVGGGCCRKCEEPGASKCATEAEPTEETPVEVPADAAVSTPDFVSEETWAMPAGPDRAKRVRLEVMTRRLGELQNEMTAASTALMEAEKKARTEDPELGRLYDQLVKGQMTYRQALGQHAAYAAAVQKNTQTMESYRTLAQQHEALKKEIGE